MPLKDVVCRLPVPAEIHRRPLIPRHAFAAADNATLYSTDSTPNSAYVNSPSGRSHLASASEASRAKPKARYAWTGVEKRNGVNTFPSDDARDRSADMKFVNRPSSPNMSVAEILCH
jgi:hypothetical protein